MGFLNWISEDCFLAVRNTRHVRAFAENASREARAQRAEHFLSKPLCSKQCAQVIRGLPQCEPPPLVLVPSKMARAKRRALPEHDQDRDRKSVYRSRDQYSSRSRNQFLQ